MVQNSGLGPDLALAAEMVQKKYLMCKVQRASLNFGLLVALTIYRNRMVRAFSCFQSCIIDGVWFCWRFMEALRWTQTSGMVFVVDWQRYLKRFEGEKFKFWLSLRISSQKAGVSNYIKPLSRTSQKYQMGSDCKAEIPSTFPERGPCEPKRKLRPKNGKFGPIPNFCGFFNHPIFI